MAIFDDLNELIQYNGDSWTNSTAFTNRTGSSTKTYVNPTSEVSITFYFFGTYLKTYGAGYTGMNTCNKITIDNVDYNMNTWGSITNNAIGVSFEKNDIQIGAHKAIITPNGSSRIYFDAVECANLISKEEYEIINNSTIEKVSHSNAFHAQTLPMNTTAKILAKTNDSREGLLGMANDDENYGDLYVVGKDGKAHLTKSGMKSEVLFEGVANTVGLYSLQHDISNYKHIIIYGDVLFSSSIKNPVSTVIDSNDCITDETMSKNYSLMIHRVLDTGSISWSGTILFSFTSKKELRVISVNKFGNHEGIRISKIIGVY